MKNLFRQIVIFLVIGSFAALINIVVLYFLTEFINIYYILSAVFAFVVSSVVSYLLNKKITFKEDMSDYLIRKGIKFFLVNIAALGFNLIILYILTDFLKMYYIFSQVVAISLASVVNFCGHKLWTFKADKK